MKKVLVILLLVLAVGCSKKYVKSTDEGAPAEGMEMEKEEVVQEQVYTGDDESEIYSEDEALIEGKTIAQDVFFDFDKYDIRPDARPTLDSVATWMNSNMGFSLVIEGHCDERGTNEYNLALGEKRAKSTRDYLGSLGVPPSRMSMITYGEENPVCLEKTESCWQRNRRAHFVVTK